MSNLYSFDDDDFPTQPPREQNISHFHDYGMSHTDQCRPVRSGLNQRAWNGSGPDPAQGPIIHSNFFQSHDDSCLDLNTGCSHAASLDADPFALFNDQPRQQLPTEQSSPWNLSQQPEYGFMANHGFSAMNGCCSSPCSINGTACEAACEEACEEPCVDSCTLDYPCDPNTFCTDTSCEKPKVCHDVYHGASILGQLMGANDGHHSYDLGPEASHANSEAAYSRMLQSLQPAPNHGLYSGNNSPYFGGQGTQRLNVQAQQPSHNNLQSMGMSHTFNQPHAGSLSSVSNAYPCAVPQQDDSPRCLTADMGSLQPSPGYSHPLGHDFDAAYIAQHQMLQRMQAQSQADQIQQQAHLNDVQLQAQLGASLSQRNSFCIPSTGQPDPLQHRQSVDTFDFNTIATRRQSEQTPRQHSQNKCDIPDLFSSPSSRGLPTPSVIPRAAIESPSPMCLPVDRKLQCEWLVDSNKICGMKFEDKQLLNAHILEDHIKLMEQDREHGFVCRWLNCNRLELKNNRKKYGFDGRAKLKRHVETHAGAVAEYLCGKCGKVCATPQALRTHLVTHSEDRPYKCPVQGCSKSFKTTDSLKVHRQNSHSNAKRYICKICKRSFKDSSNFSKHKKTHNRNKTWHCLNCEEKFVRRDQLLRHCKRVHGMPQEILDQLYPKNVRGSCARLPSVTGHDSLPLPSPILNMVAPEAPTVAAQVPTMQSAPQWSTEDDDETIQDLGLFDN